MRRSLNTTTKHRLRTSGWGRSVSTVADVVLAEAVAAVALAEADAAVALAEAEAAVALAEAVASPFNEDG